MDCVKQSPIAWTCHPVLIMRRLRSWTLSFEVVALSHSPNCGDGIQKGYAKIVKRAQIKNETEYYLIRNVLDDPTEKAPEERELLEKMISEYDAA